jgi:citrate lyase beta subunit
MTTMGRCRHLRRSFLYVPASEERKLVKAPGLGADAVILDLEDSVAPERKPEARERILGLLRETPNPAVEWLVRINALASAHFEADVGCGVRSNPDALVVAKVDGPEVVREIDRQLTVAERDAGRPVGRLKLFAMIESARAVLNAYAIATASERVAGLILGHVDLSLDLGLAPGPASQGGGDGVRREAGHPPGADSYRPRGLHALAGASAPGGTDPRGLDTGRGRGEGRGGPGRRIAGAAGDRHGATDPGACATGGLAGRHQTEDPGALSAHRGLSG